MARGLFDSARDPVRGPVTRAHRTRGGDRRKIHTVREITSRVRRAVEEGVGAVWVEGEVSNLARPASGHAYFTLKDASAQLHAVMWKNVASRFLSGRGFRLEDGDKVVVFGRLTVYEVRGQYQIVVETVEPRGLGALQAAFEKLKAKLQEEGLFDESRKRPVPFLPRAIGIVTSDTGAAIHDMLRTIWGRFPRARVVLRPAPVQGELAAGEIARAIGEFNSWGRVDVIIVGRGGGSLEDLWPFNEEVVARAIADSRIPVVSAVGHEVDVSISDLVADVRALTPTDAGTKVVPRLADLVDELERATSRLGRASSRIVAAERERLELISRGYGLRAPVELVPRERQRVDELASRMVSCAERNVSDARHELAGLAAGLDGLSPLNVLSRGYTMTFRAGERGKPVRDAAALSPGERIVTRFARGEAESVVETTKRTTETRRHGGHGRPDHG